jgi:hypothetical protein
MQLTPKVAENRILGYPRSDTVPTVAPLPRQVHMIRVSQQLVAFVHEAFALEKLIVLGAILGVTVVTEYFRRFERSSRWQQELQHITYITTMELSEYAQFLQRRYHNHERN